jgi:hypothetical protein
MRFACLHLFDFSYYVSCVILFSFHTIFASGGHGALHILHSFFVSLVIPENKALVFEGWINRSP